MKKLIFLSLLFLTLFCNAQFTNSGNTFLKTGSSFMTATATTNFCARYQAVYDAYGTKPSAAIADIYNDFLYSFDSLNTALSVSCDLLYVFAAHEADNESLINWNDPGTFDATLTNLSAVDDWTQYQGYTGDNTDGIIETNYNPTSNAINVSQDNMALGIYILSDAAEDAYIYGAKDASNVLIEFRPRRVSDGQVATWINGTAVTSQAGMTTSNGLWIASRTASNAVYIFQGGTQRDTEADLSTSLLNKEIYIMKPNDAFDTDYSSSQVALFFITTKIASATESGKYDTIVTRLLTRLGAI